MQQRQIMNHKSNIIKPLIYLLDLKSLARIELESLLAHTVLNIIILEPYN